MESKIENYDNLYLKKMLLFIIDGVQYEEIVDIFDNYIIFGNYTSKEMLELLIIKEGMLSVARGNNSLFILEKLTAIIGIEYTEEAGKTTKKIITDRRNHFYQQIKKGYKFYPDGTNLLEPKFKEINDQDLQILMREIDGSDAICAIAGSSWEVSDKFFRNMSKRNADQIADSVVSGVYYNVPEQIIAAQNRILDKIAEIESRKS
jgi:hypothetical protein